MSVLLCGKSISNKYVLNLALSKEKSLMVRNSEDKEFHSFGPAAANERSPHCLDFDLRNFKRCWSADQRTLTGLCAFLLPPLCLLRRFSPKLPACLHYFTPNFISLSQNYRNIGLTLLFTSDFQGL
ncbi:hypothetical protein AMECASPLE_020407 [Ameca splendens]|uniref:Uncharacterized protein n=1 Tax=Ameca splendens TaxID=208324 RepID=A0ABV0XGA2_9TELE